MARISSEVGQDNDSEHYQVKLLTIYLHHHIRLGPYNCLGRLSHLAIFNNGENWLSRPTRVTSRPNTDRITHSHCFITCTHISYCS